MTEQGLDFSWARPGGAAISAAGKTFVFRYCPYPGDGGKGLTLDEIADYHANGLSIGLVFESTAARPQGGRDAGLVDGALARQGAQAVGFPDDRPIYFAVDFDALPGDYPAIDDYLMACAESLGAIRVGVYGSYAVVEHCRNVESARWFWQTYAWSGGQESPYRNVYQYSNGHDFGNPPGKVDYNEAYGDDFGQWKAEEDDMTPEQVEEIVTKVIGRDFPEYLEAYLSGGFTERPNAEGVARLLEAAAAGIRTEVAKK